MGKLTRLAAALLVAALLVGCNEDKPNKGTTSLPRPEARVAANTPLEHGPQIGSERN